MGQIAALIDKVTGRQGTKRVGIGNTGSVILVDVTLSDTTKYEAEPTEHPVEKGADVTDHILVKPRQITITGIVSDAPIELKDAYSEKGLLNQLQDAAGAVTGAIGQKFGKSGVVAGVGAAIGGVAANALFASSVNPAVQTRDALINLLESKTPVNIQIARKNFPNMVLTSLEFPRDPSLGQAIKFTASFKQIRKVSSKKIIVKSSKEEVRHTAGEKESLGKQGANETDAATEVKGSVLYKLNNSFGLIKGS